jgi:hypothetical protein
MPLARTKRYSLSTDNRSVLDGFLDFPLFTDDEGLEDDDGLTAEDGIAAFFAPEVGIKADKVAGVKVNYFYIVCQYSGLLSKSVCPCQVFSALK